MHFLPLTKHLVHSILPPHSFKQLLPPRSSLALSFRLKVILEPKFDLLGSCIFVDVYYCLIGSYTLILLLNWDFRGLLRLVIFNNPMHLFWLLLAFVTVIRQSTIDSSLLFSFFSVPWRLKWKYSYFMVDLVFCADNQSPGKQIPYGVYMKLTKFITLQVLCLVFWVDFLILSLYCL